MISTSTQGATAKASAYELARQWRSSPTGRQYDYDPQKRGWSSRSDSGSLPVDVAFVRADIQRFIEQQPKVKLTANLCRDTFWFARLAAIEPAERAGRAR